MPIYTTKHRVVQAEQFTSDTAAAYAKWRIDGENGEPPLIPKGVEYSQDTGFTIETPNKGRVPVTIGSYVVRENGEYRVESAMAFETVFMPDPPVEAMPREQWDAPSANPPTTPEPASLWTAPAAVKPTLNELVEVPDKPGPDLPPPEAMKGFEDQFPGTDDPMPEPEEPKRKRK